MASSILKSSLLLCSILFSSTWALNYSSSSSSSSMPLQYSQHLALIKSVCKSTPYPGVCFDSLKLSISINISPNIITLLIQSLQIALSEAAKLSDLLASIGTSSKIIEKQKGAIQDCKDLHQITMSCIRKSVSRINDAGELADARAFLTAALTNKNTCLEGLDSVSGPSKPVLVASVVSAYKHISNSLSMLPKIPAGKTLIGHRNRRLLQSSGDEYDPGDVITVAADGTGNFSTIMEAVNFAPYNSDDRVIIYIREGVYHENVEIPSYKTNIVLLGDGADVTVITGNRSVVDGWTTFRSATVAVSGDGFLARDITFENGAGPGKHQAVALRINADLSAVYRCTINGYQDTLYVHSFRQFYRECDISGTIDFIFGNAAAVFQACNIISRMPLPGQFTVITAQSRDTPDEDSGISIQNCSILATDDLYSNSSSVKSYLGRPWRVYSRTVYIESYLDGFIDPAGWTEWSGDQGLDTLYYGEYENAGPSSGTEERVTWPGYHVMEYYDASDFTVSQFITGDEWLDSTSFPYDDWV